MPTHRTKELEQLKPVVRNGGLRRTIRRCATMYFFERDAVLAASVIESDLWINLMDHEIDEFCLRLLALEQPLAVDLRFICWPQRGPRARERGRDQAVNIAERAILLSQRPPRPPITRRSWPPCPGRCSRPPSSPTITATRPGPARLQHGRPLDELSSVPA